MIAGDHLDTNSGHATAARGGDSLGTWRIDHALKSQESQASCDMVMFQPRVIGGGVTSGKGEDPEAIGGHALNDLAHLRLVERDKLTAICQCCCATFDEPLGSAFLVNHTSDGGAVKRRHKLVFRLERDRVKPWVSDGQRGFEKPSLARDDRQSGLRRIALNA